MRAAGSSEPSHVLLRQAGSRRSSPAPPVPRQGRAARVRNTSDHGQQTGIGSESNTGLPHCPSVPPTRSPVGGEARGSAAYSASGEGTGACSERRWRVGRSGMVTSWKRHRVASGSVRAPGMAQSLTSWHVVPEVKLPTVAGRKGDTNRATALPRCCVGRKHEVEPAYVANSEPAVWHRGAGRADSSERDPISGEAPRCEVGRDVGRRCTLPRHPSVLRVSIVSPVRPQT